MTALFDAKDQALLLQDRLQVLGVSSPHDREVLLGRLRRQRHLGESLSDTLDRRLCEWLKEQLIDFALSGKDRATLLAAAEAAVVLSGIGQRWPLSLFDNSSRLPGEAMRRLKLALPLATPPVVNVPMPAQPLEAPSLRDLLPKAGGRALPTARAKAR